MAKKKIVAVFLSMLMFVYFNNNLPFELRPYSGHHHSANFFAGVQHSGHLYSLDLSFTKHTAKKEHVKVRYMGSHVGFQSVPVLLTLRTETFVSPRILARSYSFVSSDAHFIFKLRGPPAPAA